MPNAKQETEKKKVEPPKVGDAVSYWPEQRPFVGRGPYPAKVVAVLDGGYRLAVDNPNTGRSFFANAALSETPASGAFTVTQAAPTAAPATAPAPVKVSTSVSGGGSA